MQRRSGIPEAIARQAISTGAVSYLSRRGREAQPDSLFCFDLELPASFSPQPVDGEVESFELYPVDKIIEILAEGGSAGYKPNCNLVVIDFLIRNGVIAPESPRYLELVAGLREISTCK